MEKNNPEVMEKIVALAKRRGLVYPSSEIYGGFANTYTFGPYGAQLKKNIKDLWWKEFVSKRSDMVGLDGPILIHPKAWDASGHTKGFNDALVDCRSCKFRFRADHLVMDSTGKDLEGNLDELKNELARGIKCPNCGKADWTEPKDVNMMFKTQMNSYAGDVYLRPETAGAIFVEFKNILDSMRVKIPFGIAQIGKAFRNEIVARNFIFRIREFEQMEIEYFIHPKDDWRETFNAWLVSQKSFLKLLGIKDSEIREYNHPKNKLSHYSKKTVDIEYLFPFGFSELTGLANRGNFDLSEQSRASGVDLSYTDHLTKEKFLPHVIEPTFGLERAFLAALCSAYKEEKDENETRVVLSLPAIIAPVKVAVFPLLKNKPELINKAKKLFEELSVHFETEFDDNGNIGKRYRRQDEIGTPLCVTVDFDTLTDKAVTIRNRDTKKQERISINKLVDYIKKTLSLM